MRSLAGIAPIDPLTRRRLPAVPDGHGLVVVGSHVGLTTRQVEAVEGLREFELDVDALDPEGVGAQVREALAHERRARLHEPRPSSPAGSRPPARCRAVTEVVQPRSMPNPPG